METTTTDLVAHERNLNSMSTITLVFTLTAVSMTFGALIVVFLMRALREAFWSHIELPGTLWLSSAILIASGVVFEFARKKLRAGDVEGAHRMLVWTTSLGALFLVGQVTAGVQILRSGVVMTNNPHSWFIFIFSGLHGAHILAGLAGLIVLCYRTKERASGPRYQMGTRVGLRGVGIFWHYMDGMWLLLFGLLVFWKR